MRKPRSPKPETRHFLSLREWAELKGVELDRIEAIKLGKIVKGDYKEKYGKEPRNAYRKNPNTGNTIHVGLGYEALDLPLIEAGLRKVKEQSGETSNLE